MSEIWSVFSDNTTTDVAEINPRPLRETECNRRLALKLTRLDVATPCMTLDHQNGGFLIPCERFVGDLKGCKGYVAGRKNS
jgi:hypothetical protein